MKTMHVFLTLLLATVSISAISASKKKSQPDSFTLARHGKDAEGVSMDERVYIHSVKGLQWTTGARGAGDCPSQAGVFVSTVDKEQFMTLQSRALEIFSEQDKMPDKKVDDNQARPDATSISTLVVWKNGEDHFTPIKEWTPLLATFHRELAQLQGKAGAKNAVEISVRRKGSDAVVSFKKLGDHGQFEITLPSVASEAFHSNLGADVHYSAAPKNLHVLLKKGQETTITLKNIPKDATQIWFSNHISRHHGGSHQQDIAICSPIR